MNTMFQWFLALAGGLGGTPVNLLFFKDKVLGLIQFPAALAFVFNNRAVET